jgi:hypothetical protein
MKVTMLECMNFFIGKRKLPSAIKQDYSAYACYIGNGWRGFTGVGNVCLKKAELHQ